METNYERDKLAEKKTWTTPHIVALTPGSDIGTNFAGASADFTNTTTATNTVNS